MPTLLHLVHFCSTTQNPMRSQMPLVVDSVKYLLHIYLFFFFVLQDVLRQALVSTQKMKKKIYKRNKHSVNISFFDCTICLLSSIVQVNDCKTESSLCSATLSHAAPSSQGMAKVQDGHTNACDRYSVLYLSTHLM